MKFSKGDRVTNDKGWHGVVDRVETSQPTEDGLYVWVWWKEREQHVEKIVQRKPVCGHLTSQIKRLTA